MDDLKNISDIIPYLKKLREDNYIVYIFLLYFIIIIGGFISFFTLKTMLFSNQNNAFLLFSFLLLLIGWFYTGFFESNFISKDIELLQIVNNQKSFWIDIINFIIAILLLAMFITLLLNKVNLFIPFYLFYTILELFFTIFISDIFENNKAKIKDKLYSKFDKIENVDINKIFNKIHIYFCGKYKFLLIGVRIILTTIAYFYLQKNLNFSCILVGMSIIINEIVFLYIRLPIYKIFYKYK